MLRFLLLITHKSSPEDNIANGEDIERLFENKVIFFKKNHVGIISQFLFTQI